MGWSVRYFQNYRHWNDNNRIYRLQLNMYDLKMFWSMKIILNNKELHSGWIWTFKCQGYVLQVKVMTILGHQISHNIL